MREGLLEQGMIEGWFTWARNDRGFTLERYDRWFTLARYDRGFHLVRYDRYYWKILNLPLVYLLDLIKITLVLNLSWALFYLNLIEKV